MSFPFVEIKTSLLPYVFDRTLDGEMSVGVLSRYNILIDLYEQASRIQMTRRGANVP